MKFLLKNDFCKHDDNNQPYSIEVEKDNPYYHLNGKCDEKGYAVLFSGARAYLDVPQVRTFHLSFNLLHNHSHAKGYNETFVVLFGYDRQNRMGYQLEFVYLEKGGSIIRLTKAFPKKKEVIKEQAYDFIQECDTKYFIDIEVTEDCVHCQFADCVFVCELQSVKGKVALMRESAFLEMYVTDLTFESEEIQQRKIGEYQVKIPQYNGMSYPYVLTLTAYDLGEGIVKVDYEFSEGLFVYDTRNEFVGDTWAMLYEEFDSLYFKINDSKRYYLKNGLVRIFEENFTPKDQGMYAVKESVCDLHKALVDTWRQPENGSVTMKAFGDIETITFGYKNIRCFRSEFLASPMQYIFDKNGKELYIGEPLDEQVAIAVSSPLSQGLEKLIPESVYEREKLIEHLTDNHYFLTTDENISFGVDIRSQYDYQAIEIKAYLQDAFYNTLQEVDTVLCDKAFRYPEFTSKSYQADLKTLSLGVYHFYIEVFYCGLKIAWHRSAFEVIDPNSSVSPQRASGLFRSHVGDSGKKPCPNLWLKQPDFNIEHYIDILLIDPKGANKMRVWEVYPIFKKEINCWMNQRCVSHQDILNNVPLTYDITKYADYLYFQTPGEEEKKVYHRYDFYVYRHFKTHLLGMCERFLCENEDIRKELGLKNVTEEFTLENYKLFMQKYSTKFINYCLPQITRLYLEQWKEVKKINPKAKRFSYGPLSLYIAAYGGASTLKWQGNDPKRLHEMFDGYLQFEDYPHDCNYSTTKGAFALGTIQYLDPKVKIFPEIYDSWLEGCPDEALPGAHPPLGYFYCQPYACMTQIFEYIYNTSHYFADKKEYGYWREFGLMLFSAYVTKTKEKFDEMLPAWGKAMENKPVKPLRGCVFLYEIPEEDDRFNPDCSYDQFAGGDYGLCGRPVHNISETGLSYVYRMVRESGIPVNTITSYSALNYYNQENTDILVIPSLKGVKQEIKEKIRELYEKGTPIIAVSEVEGLEDIFGVTLNRRRTRLTYLTDKQQTEHIAPIDTEVYYDVTEGKVLLYADNDEPILIQKGNALLINAPIGEVGIETLKYAAFLGAYNISSLLENIVTDTITKLSTSKFRASKRCGITPFVNEKQEDILLLIDYSKDLDGIDYENGRLVEVNIPKGYKGVEGIYNAKDIGAHTQNGNITKIILPILRQQSVLVKLIK